MTRMSITLTAVQQRALAWAARLPEGITARSRACAYTATMRRLVDHGLVVVVERNDRGDPVRATITDLGRRVAADLGLTDPDQAGTR